MLFTVQPSKVQRGLLPGVGAPISQAFSQPSDVFDWTVQAHTLHELCCAMPTIPRSNAWVHVLLGEGTDGVSGVNGRMSSTYTQNKSRRKKKSAQAPTRQRAYLHVDSSGRGSAGDRRLTKRAGRCWRRRGRRGLRAAERCMGHNSIRP